MDFLQMAMAAFTGCILALGVHDWHKARLDKWEADRKANLKMIWGANDPPK